MHKIAVSWSLISAKIRLLHRKNSQVLRESLIKIKLSITFLFKMSAARSSSDWFDVCDWRKASLMPWIARNIAVNFKHKDSKVELEWYRDISLQAKETVWKVKCEEKMLSFRHGFVFWNVMFFLLFRIALKVFANRLTVQSVNHP